MDLEIIAWILTAVLGIATAIFGKKLFDIKKEIKDVFVAIDNALSDNKLSKEELLNVMAEAKEALTAIKGIFKKGGVQPSTP